MPYYDKRIVSVHGGAESTVFLVNEAPGPCEAHYRIPSVGQQGGNIYWAFRRAKIGWTCEFEKFSWPRKIRECYKDPSKMSHRFELRDEFLSIRAKYLACSNAYPYWPRSNKITWDWVDPSQDDVLSEANIKRLKDEILSSHQVILVCGEYAWLACHGSELPQPSTREGTALSRSELKHINSRLSSAFSAGWYMGHTRRWSFDVEKISKTLKSVENVANWSR